MINMTIALSPIEQRRIASAKSNLMRPLPGIRRLACSLLLSLALPCLLQAGPVDNIAPQITSIVRLTPSGQVAPRNAVVFEVTFSEDVTGVDTNRFVTSHVNDGSVIGTVTSVAGGPVDYQVTVDITAGKTKGRQTFRSNR